MEDVDLKEITFAVAAKVGNDRYETEFGL